MDAFRLGNFFNVKEPFLRLSSYPVRLTNLFIHFYSMSNLRKGDTNVSDDFVNPWTALAVLAVKQCF